MSNGYGGSSGSSSSSRRSSSSGSYSEGGNFSGGFNKIKNGVEAPLGFHYMANGKLMNDAHHIAKFGYIERVINNVDIDYRDINLTGGSKTISISGDPGIVFSVEVYEGSQASYYNFEKNTWSANSYKLTNVQAATGRYTANINFEANASQKIYTINIYAETVENIKTMHAFGAEVKDDLGSKIINASKGSDSSVITKKIYQDVERSIFISAIAPSLYLASANTVNGAVSSSNRIVIDGDATSTSLVQVGDKVTGSGIAASVHALVTKINPDNDNTNEIEISVADSIGDGQAITFTPPFNGMTPHYTESSSGRDRVLATGMSNVSANFTVTLTAQAGRCFTVNRTPTAEDLCCVNLVTFGSVLFIPGFTEAERYFRWQVDNVANISNGMIMDPARSGSGANTVPSTIADFIRNTTLQKIQKSRYSQTIVDYDVRDIFIPGVDRFGNIPAASGIDRNGVTQVVAGNLLFDANQPGDLDSDADVRIIAQGPADIKKSTGASVSLTDVVLTPTQVSTTVDGAVSNSTTITLSKVSNITVGSSVRGVGIADGAANPTVVSKSVSTGAGNIVLSAAQTLEDGATLFFDGPSNILTITGKIKIVNMPIVNNTLYFNVEKFLTCL